MNLPIQQRPEGATLVRDGNY